MLTQQQAYLICEAHEIFSLLNNDEEMELLEMHNPEMLEAYCALHRVAASVDTASNEESEQAVEIEQVKHAETPNEMRAEINRMTMHDALTRQVIHMALLREMPGEDRYTMLAYTVLKAKQEGMQRELNAAKNAPMKPMEFGAPSAGVQP